MHAVKRRLALPLLLVAVAGTGWRFESIYILKPPQRSGECGASIAVGEIDADGFADIAVGAPGDASNGLDAGAVYLFSGRKRELIHELKPDSLEQRFGQSVTFSDVDGDGLSDLVIGAPGWRDARGAVYVAVKLRKKEPPKLLRVLEGRRDGDRLGWCVAGAPARPGMEIEGILVGAPGHDEAGLDDAGRAVLVKLKGSRLEAETVRDWEGDTLLAELGAFVGLAADQDDDGTRDLFVGEPGAENGDGVATGALRLVDGADGEMQRRFFGRAEGDRFGSTASTIRAHGEGVQYHEILVGSERGRYAQLFTGDKGKLRRTFESPPGEVDFGADVSGSLRMGPGYDFGFVIATPTRSEGEEAGAGQFRGLRVYSGETLDCIAEQPMFGLGRLGLTLLTAEIDADPAGELLVGHWAPTDGHLEVLRVLPED